MHGAMKALELGVLVTPVIRAYVCILIIFTGLYAAAWWTIFTKAGHKGWKCLIPFYNVRMIVRIADISVGWFWAYTVLVLASVVVPISIIIATICFYAIAVDIPKVFGKNNWFCLGMFVPVLNLVLLMIVAFGSATYSNPTTSGSDVLNEGIEESAPRGITSSPPPPKEAPAISAPPPGWYSDPLATGGLRYWDGATWTEHLHEA